MTTGNPQLFFTTIASGATHSGAISLKSGVIATAHFPVCTSGTWTTKASFDTSSGNFTTMLGGDGLSNFAPAIAGGSLALPLNDCVFTAPYFKFVCSNAQADTRTIVIATKVI